MKVNNDLLETAFEALKKEYDRVSAVGNSIGAYFSMFALQNNSIEKAFSISPILDMDLMNIDKLRQ